MINADAPKVRDGYVREYDSSGFSQKMMSRLRQIRAAQFAAEHKMTSLLEVGVGDYSLANELRLRSTRLVCVEPRMEFIARNQANTSERMLAELHYVNGKIEDLKTRQQVASLMPDPDLVVINSLLHEIPNLAEFLEALNEVTELGCTTWINVPNPWSYHYAVWEKLEGFAPKEDDSAALAFGRKRLLDRNQWIAILGEAGWSLASSCSVGIKPLTISQLDLVAATLQGGTDLVAAMLATQVPEDRGAELDFVFVKTREMGWRS